MAKDKWIQSSVKHPGAVKEAAAKHGKSVAAEAKSEEKSPNKKIAARGRLALRFKGLAGKGKNIRKPGTKKKSISKRSS